MQSRLSPPKKVWITSYSLFLVSCLVLWAIVYQTFALEVFVISYLLASFPLNWFLYRRHLLPFTVRFIEKWYPNWNSNFLTKYVFHYVNLFLFIFLYWFAVPICYILWLIEKQIQLSR